LHKKSDLIEPGSLHIGGQLLVAFLGLIMSVGINPLPIFLMRYNRIRIANLLNTTVRAIVDKSIR
jgi:hypothetical protein